jgi:lipopolysaccharide transport system permease protein
MFLALNEKVLFSTFVNHRRSGMYYLKISPSKSRFSLNIKELYNSGELIYFFTWRDIKVKYKQTILGFLWAVLQPLLMMLIFTFFFGRVLNVPSGNLPYPVFVFAGLLLWNLFSGGITNSSNSMIANANIIKKIYFPRLIIPLSSILGSVFDYFMALIIFIGIMFWYQVNVSLGYFVSALILSLLLTTLGTIGPGFLLAALNVKYRDFRYVVPFMMQALLFITPVIYPVNMVTNPFVKILVYINPISGAISLIRNSLSGLAPDYTLIACSTASAFILALTGLYYFKRTESYFADLA